jgi:hypothetical protein
MKIKSFIIVGALCAALYTPIIAGPVLPAAAGEDTGLILSQYLDDKEDGRENRSRKGTVLDLRNKELSRPQPRFILGIGGGANAREGFGSVILTAPLGILYERFTVTADPGFVYTNAKSMRGKKGVSLDNMIRTKINGQIYQFDLPFKFSYSILDLAMYPYTPYVTAGIGYSLWKFSLSGSSPLSHVSHEYYINSMMLSYGFGFFVKTTEDTRFNIGFNGVSYFNKRLGEFNYDTTGVSLLFGMMVIFN